MILNKREKKNCYETKFQEIENSLNKHLEFRKQASLFSDVVQSLIDVRLIVFEMIDVLSEIIWFKNRDFKFLFLNRKMAEQVYGRKRNEIIGRTHNELHNSQGPVITDLITYQERKKCKFIQTTFTSTGGRLFECYKIPLFSEEQTFRGIVGCGRDITNDFNINLKQLTIDGVITHLENGFYYYINKEDEL